MSIRGIVDVIMFETLLVKPIINIITFIYAVLPGHNFAIALIIFTVLVKFAMWPLMKKQLHHTKAMRKLRPELKKIKVAAKGDRQKEAMLTMALYKEKEISPFAPIGLLLVQLPILIALYSGVSRIVNDPNTVLNLSYGFIRELSWMKELATDISKFDMSLFGLVDLKRIPLRDTVYWPAMVIVALSAASQYMTSRQVMVTDKDSRKLRTILKDAKEGKEADNAEVSAAVGGMMIYFIPFMVFFISLNLAAALSFYWLISSIITYFQQAVVLKQDSDELSTTTARIKVDSTSTAKVVEAEVISKKPKKSPTKNKKGPSKSSNKKRR